MNLQPPAAPAPDCLPSRKERPWAWRYFLVFCALVFGCLAALPVPAQTQTNFAILSLEGSVEVLSPDRRLPRAAVAGGALEPGDVLFTATNSRCTLRTPNGLVLPVRENTKLEILPGAKPGLHLWRGLLSFFHRGEPGQIDIRTPTVRAGIRGTEFVVAVEPWAGGERTTVSVVDGAVELANAAGQLTLTNLQQAVADTGRAPQRTPGFTANNVLQWCFYYPGVLDQAELPLTPEETNRLAASLTAYQQGNLPAALARLPTNGPPGSAAVRLYVAAVGLAVGRAEAAEAELRPLAEGPPGERTVRLASGLLGLLAAVRQEAKWPGATPELATECLAASYFEQSQPHHPDSLREARRLARRATEVSPGFGFAWVRLAELEFSFGRTAAARDALAKGLSLAPGNAQAAALEGFLLAADHRFREARAAFEHALALDSSLGNAWLGRGLCRLRRGDLAGGREDLMVAAALEPQRSLLRSYLGKGYGITGENRLAEAELRRARELDPQDPTPWLYAALLAESGNRINEAVRDLEMSETYNDNRALVRSPFLLDQDRAVRGANLARVYDEAGLTDVARREAGAAVAADYAGYGGHLFLANAYDPGANNTPYNQQNYTAYASEYLLAALLGPPDPRLLSQPVSQQEYTRLFDRDGLGFFSASDYWSRGAWRQDAVQYGSFAGTSWAVEGIYQSDPGQAPNAGFTQRYYTAKIKEQVTPQDSFYLEAQKSTLSGGDLALHYDPATTVAGQTVRDQQSPGLLLGYHHEWSPESHTLVLVSHLNDRNQSDTPYANALLLAAYGGAPWVALATDLTRQYNREYSANSLELQQAQVLGWQQLILGGRVQQVHERIQDQDTAQTANLSGGNYAWYFPSTPYAFPSQQLNTVTRRESGYAFDYWRLADGWRVFAGVVADRLETPANTLAPPFNSDTLAGTTVSPRLGLFWQPTPAVGLVAGYSRSVTGGDWDGGASLEPSQTFGLPSTLRTAFPDSLTGGVKHERMEIWLADGRLRLGENTHVILGAEQIASKAALDTGAYTSDFAALTPTILPTSVSGELHFREQSAHASLRRFLGGGVSVGARYEAARAELTQDYATAPALSALSQGLLQSVGLDALVTTPGGFFAQTKATWRQQNSLTETMQGGGVPAVGGGLPDDCFWQFDGLAGYRSPHRRFQATVGLLNLTGQDYRLHPVNSYLDLPRTRTLALNLRFTF